MTLDLATAGESHGPALVAILSGLPAGLVLDRAAIDADLRRRQQGYGARRASRSRPTRSRCSPGFARADARDAARACRPQPGSPQLDVGDEPVAARGRTGGQGHKAGDVAAAGARGSPPGAEVRAPDVRDALQRPPRGTRPPTWRPARSRRRRSPRSGSWSRAPRCRRRADPATVDEARRDRDTLGGTVEVRATGFLRGLLVRAREDGSRAARGGADGDPGGEGRRDRRRLRARRLARLGCARRDLPRRAPLPEERTAPGRRGRDLEREDSSSGPRWSRCRR